MKQIVKRGRDVVLVVIAAGLSSCTALAFQAATSSGQADGTSVSVTADIEKQLAELYQRVSPAVVGVKGLDGDRSSHGVGLIVTPEGLVLTSHRVAGRRIAVTLTDGRRATGHALGWSSEWGIGLGKLDETGPWPHVPIVEAPVRAGQPLATLVYPVNEKEPVWRRRACSGEPSSIGRAEPLVSSSRPAKKAGLSFCPLRSPKALMNEAKHIIDPRTNHSLGPIGDH